MKKRGISAVVATVLIILLVVSGVGIVWLGIMPMIADINIDKSAGLRLVSTEGHTLWDPESRLSTVQIERAAEGPDIYGIDIVFSFDGNTVTHFVEDVPGLNGKRVYHVNLSEYSGDLDSIKIIPIFWGGIAGGVASELKIERIPEADIAQMIEDKVIDAEDFVVPSGSGGGSSNNNGGSSGGSSSGGDEEVVCGNDVIEDEEVCDGSDLGLHGCVLQGFDFGELACLEDCSGYNVSGCASNDPVVGLGDLTIPESRLPKWNPGVEGGIPNITGWNVIEANEAPYNIVGDGVTEVGTTLQQALDDAAAAGVPTVVHLNAGDYILGYGVHLALASNVALDGEGPDETLITYYVRNGGAYTFRDTVIIGSDYARVNYMDVAPAINLSNNASRGGINVTTIVAHNLSVDDWVIIAEIGKDPTMFQSYGTNGDAEMISHIAKVTAIDGFQVTFDRPLRIDMRTEYDAQIRKLEMTENAGVQDLALLGDANSESSGPIAFSFAANSWLYNVELSQPRNRFLVVDRAARNTIEKIIFTGPSLVEGGVNNYGIELKEGAQDNLITNNIFDMLYTVLLFHEGASGNVASYNYVATSRNSDSDGWQFDMECHGQYPHENLLEGNDLYHGGRHDTFWGNNGPRNTWFRNRMSHGTGNNLKYGADGWYFEPFRSDSHDDQIILILNHVNVMTASYGWNTAPGWFIDSLENTAGTFDAAADNTNMWIERNVATDDSGVTGINAEPIASTTMVDNYYGDAAPDSWDLLDLPASLYLDSRPSWWSPSKEWPGIGAGVDNYSADYINLPAQDRYEGLLQ